MSTQPSEQSETSQITNSTESSVSSVSSVSTPGQHKIDFLSEDAPLNLQVTKQRYVCISFVSPEGIKNCNLRSLKIRGVFEEYEQAKNFAANLQKNDPAYHIFVGEMGKWLPWDPSPNSVKDQHYYEDQLQKLHKGYLENREKAKQAESDRKREMIERSVAEASSDRNKAAQDKLKHKFEESKLKKEAAASAASLTTSSSSSGSQQSENKLKSIEENLKKLREIQNSTKTKK
jgi:hypothetical protein